MPKTITAEAAKRLAKVTGKDALEQSFANHWMMCHPLLPVPVRQHKFHAIRKWRFDFAWPKARVAIELDGGIFLPKSRHTHPISFEKDHQKFNAAVLLGWRVGRFTKGMMKSGEAESWLKQALNVQL